MFTSKKVFLSLSIAKNKKALMKTNFEFYLYPENKIYLNELDQKELKQFINYLKGTK